MIRNNNKDMNDPFPRHHIRCADTSDVRNRREPYTFHGSITPRSLQRRGCIGNTLPAAVDTMIELPSRVNSMSLVGCCLDVANSDLTDGRRDDYEGADEEDGSNDP